MPFKSDQQRKLFFAKAKTSPKWAKMAKHWAAVTGKKKLPHRVGEQLGPDNDEVPMEPMASAASQMPAVTEMPHLELDAIIAGQHFGVVDLRIERYPISAAKKRELMTAQAAKGVLARVKGGSWIVIGPGEKIHQQRPEDADLLKLPDDWQEYMITSESVEANPYSEDQLDMTSIKRSTECRLPSMTEVFVRRRR